MAATAAIRPAGEAELDLLAGLYERAHFHPVLATVDRFARDVLGGQVYVAERDGALVGASGCAHFGPTGWVGAVAVVPEARRGGLGRALTEVAVAWLRERGATTIQLYATDMGRPVYERLGFVAEGTCVTLGGSWQPGRQPPGVRAARAEDLPAALAVDREATGEDRVTLLTSLWPGPPHPAPGAPETAGPAAARPQSAALGAPGTAVARARTAQPGVALVIEVGGEVRGYHLPSPWRPGGATVAADLSGGLALLEATGRRLDGADLSLSIPEGNAPAIRALEAGGQTERSRTTRMRLGPPLPWRPHALFSTFNLFWG